MDKLSSNTPALITISREEYHKDIKKYLELTKGSVQVCVISGNSPMILLGRGPKLFKDPDEQESVP